ncbi:MAG: hypothetical protein NXH75_04915 [Halobacteriovoraceae bacterium]|nr:hypothetical protein [Halobacteriovoraceae bacterium]
MAKDKNKEEKPEAVPKSYQDRLKFLRKAQEYSAADEIPKAVEHYSQYLNALALFNHVDESKLDPKMFDQEKDLAELFLISHAYWDLAKAYDRSPNLHLESIRCLDQFVKFTIGYKYQYVNSRTIKAFIKKRLAHNPKAFKEAFERIHIESKGCFIAGDIYGPHDPRLGELRAFKNDLVKTTLGFAFVDFYYNHLCPFYFRIKKAPGVTYLFSKLVNLSVLLNRKYRRGKIAND